MSKILFLTTAHKYNDDRIFYHQAKELRARGNEVKIVSLSSDFIGNIEGIEVESYSILTNSTRNKINVLEKIIKNYKPNSIICSEPLAIVSTKVKQHNTKVFYDITEWYPSKRMVQNLGFPFNFFKFLYFFAIQIYAGYLSTHFIFGENTKKFPLAFLFPWKIKTTIPYYPDPIYIDKNIKKLDQNKIGLVYTGPISREKGIENFFHAADAFRKRNPHIQVNILIVGKPRHEGDDVYFNNLLSQFKWENIEIKTPTSFLNFTSSYKDFDICFDLREVNFENSHSLPIKLFYYAASGKPVIYSNLKSITKHLDIHSFGHVVNPNDSIQIAKIIENYCENPQLYLEHAQNARNAFEMKFNWHVLRDRFVQFIEKG